MEAMGWPLIARFTQVWQSLLVKESPQRGGSEQRQPEGQSSNRALPLPAVPMRLLPARYLSRVKVRNADVIARELDEAEALVNRLSEEWRAKQNRLLAVESGARAELDRHYRELTDAAAGKRSALCNERRLAAIDSRFERVNMDFLKETSRTTLQKAMMPRFAKFDWHSIDCVLQASVYSNSTYVPDRGYDLSGLVEYARSCMNRSSERGSTVHVYAKAKIAMALPAGLKELACEAKGLFTEIFIITEAPRWVICRFSSCPAAPVSRGPIALIGRSADEHWFLGQFN
jgi:hypothetical protein